MIPISIQNLYEIYDNTGYYVDMKFVKRGNGKIVLMKEMEK